MCTPLKSDNVALDDDGELFIVRSGDLAVVVSSSLRTEILWHVQRSISEEKDHSKDERKILGAWVAEFLSGVPEELCVMFRV